MCKSCGNLVGEGAGKCKQRQPEHVFVGVQLGRKVFWEESMAHAKERRQGSICCVQEAAHGVSYLVHEAEDTEALFGWKKRTSVC